MANSDFIDKYKDKFYIPIGAGCWLWRKCARGNYPVITYKGKGWTAHRLFYDQLKEKVSSDLVIDHLCNTKNCVNPAHLEQVTHKENVKRGMRLYKHTKRYYGGSMTTISKADLKLFFKSHKEIADTMGVSKQWVDVISEVKNPEQQERLREKVRVRMKEIVQAFARIQENRDQSTNP